MAGIRVKAVGSTRTVTRVRVRDAAGVLRFVSRIRMRDAGNVLRTVFSGFSASIPTTVSASSATSPITTAAVAVTVSGGNAPFTYNWRVKNNDPATYNVDGISILAPTTSSTQFRASIPTPGDGAFGSFECVVTDSLGNSVTSNSIDVSIIRT